VSLTLLALLGGACSLDFPSTPSYDPWSWLVWGRQILHGQLHITGGSSWKPLPVIFTTVLAIFGSAAPNLWLLIARAGAFLAVLMTAKLAARLTWELGVSRPGLDPATDGGWQAFAARGWWQKLIVAAPAVLAAVIALLGVTFTRGYPGNSMLGYSEGLMGAAVLIGVERAYDGHHRQAFALGIAAALDRPEFWAIWIPYGIWVCWQDRGALRLVIGLVVLAILLWIVPQKLGGQSAGGLLSHAKNNHSKQSAVNSADPFRTELKDVIIPLVLQRVEIAAGLVMLLAAAVFVRTRRRLGGWIAAVRGHRALALTALIGLAGCIWGLGIAVETQEGFAGNPRYAVLGAMFVYVAGAAGFGWACYALARLVTRRRYLLTPLLLSTAAMTVVFLLVPKPWSHRISSPASIRHALRFQDQIRESLVSAIDDTGGPQRMLACGTITTNNFQVTMVAWYLDVPINRVWATPGSLTKPGVPPNVIFQTPPASGNTATPYQQQIRYWENHDGIKYKVFPTKTGALYLHCAS